MTPETEALIAHVRVLKDHLARTITQHRREGLYMDIADLAPQLTTALEAAEKRADALQNDKDVLTGQLQEARRRADAAEAKLKVAQSLCRDLAKELEPRISHNLAACPGKNCAPHRLIRKALTQLKP